MELYIKQYIYDCDLHSSSLSALRCYTIASVMLNLEKNKSDTFQKKKTKQEEFSRYEKGRQKADKMHEDLRLAVIDHKISNVKKEPMKLIKIRKHLDAIEKSQTSQKQLLKYLSVQEKLTDDLASCAQQGDLEACRDLIRQGAVVNEVDSAGFLPLHYACSAGFYEVAKLLLEFGSDCSSYLTGFSSIVIAAKNGHAKVVELLVSFGCSVEDSGAAGTPPLVAACSTNQVGVLQVLVNLGANLNSSDVEGNSALHVCAKTEQSAQAIRFLLMSGADTKLMNIQGITAITVRHYTLPDSGRKAIPMPV
jgi:ankyrin repeat protein